jgi:DNA-binding transcriptional ArsR family regulator
METAAARADTHQPFVGGGTEEGPGLQDLELGSILHALSDPMRLRIVAVLAREGERACSSFDLPIVKSTCTHHFRVLRESGVIRQRIVGTSRLNSLRREELDLRFPGLLDAVLQAARRLTI